MKGVLKIILKILSTRRSTNSFDLTQILTAPLEVGKFFRLSMNHVLFFEFFRVCFCSAQLKNAKLVQERKEAKVGLVSHGEAKASLAR